MNQISTDYFLSLPKDIQGHLYPFCDTQTRSHLATAYENEVGDSPFIDEHKWVIGPIKSLHKEVKNNKAEVKSNLSRLNQIGTDITTKCNQCNDTSEKLKKHRRIKVYLTKTINLTHNIPVLSKIGVKLLDWFPSLKTIYNELSNLSDLNHDLAKLQKEKSDLESANTYLQEVIDKRLEVALPFNYKRYEDKLSALNTIMDLFGGKVSYLQFPDLGAPIKDEAEFKERLRKLNPDDLSKYPPARGVFKDQGKRFLVVRPKNTLKQIILIQEVTLFNAKWMATVFKQEGEEVINLSDENGVFNTDSINQLKLLLNLPND